MPTRLTETTPLSEAGTATTEGRMRVVAISAGIGSSGYYSPDVLREAADNDLISNGTFLYLDHPTETDDRDRPERSVRDIAAVFTGPAAYDAAEEALVGEIQVFSPYRDLLTEMAPHIGLSIRGSATDVTEGEHDGRKVKVIEGLHSIDSVDFVTKAGRGGKVVELLESARVNKRAIGHGISEATVNDTREALQNALRDAYPSGDDTNHWVWVRDFDDTTVWFEIEGGDDAGVYGQSYAENDGAVTLTGDREEVRVVTNYVSAARPDSTTTTESQKETLMGTIQIEEAEHTRLTETAGRVDVLESENATLKAENETLKEADARRTRIDRARELIGTAAQEADVEFTPLEVKGLLADLPLKEGALDEDAFTTAVKEDAAAKKVASGVGRVHGFGGGSGESGAITWADIDEAQGLEKQGA